MTSASLAIADSPPLLPEIRGLDELWALYTGRPERSRLHDRQPRLLLDVLGLGLEQTITWARNERPDWAAFQDWVLATAGPPDPLKVARYHAWLDGVPPPEAVRHHLQAIEDAEPVLDADDLAHWDSEGYVILRRAITAEQAKAAEALLWRTVQATPDDAQSWYAPSPNGIMIQVFQDPALDAARHAARVHKAFAQLWGTADLWSIVDRMSFNPPERTGHSFRGPRLHWDTSIAPPIPFETQGILYLTDTSADQGAFQLVPRFHRRMERWLAEIGDADPRQVDLSGEAKSIAAGAGDLIIWRNDLPHGASPNRSDKPRMAQYVNMYPADLKDNPVWR
jgi:hypothetical protein